MSDIHPMKIDLCQKILIGSFVEGYFHNLRGLLQNLSLHLQKILFQEADKCPPGVINEVKSAFNDLKKLGCKKISKQLNETCPQMEITFSPQMLLWKIKVSS